MSKFDTRISAYGPNGNTMFVLAAAGSMMKQLGVDRGEIAALRGKVFSSGSYQEAMDAIREWFPVDCEEDA